jgi:hypothetical protein
MTFLPKLNSENQLPPIDIGFDTDLTIMTGMAVQWPRVPA